ncbi:MAG: sigma-70 family RNA polymerase sigma factor [Planctomycetales bacterium]|nr:sigma-70 family RNA polymerase sigma factor [Planctomycetales bacterium]
MVESEHTDRCDSEGGCRECTRSVSRRQAKRNTTKEPSYDEEQARRLLPAAQAGELWARHRLLVLTENLRTLGLRRLTRAHRAEADFDDYCQESVFWCLEAIDGYRFDRNCTFKTYMNRMLQWKFLDHRRRRNKRSRLPVCVEWIPLSQDGEEPVDYRRREPHAAAESREQMDRLEQLLGHLSEEDDRLWRLLRAQRNIREIAQELNITYDVARSRRRRFLNWIGRQLTG